MDIPEAKSLRWLANMFPYTEGAMDDVDKMSNCIHLYATNGANKIDELANRKQGTWIYNTDDWTPHRRCSECGYNFPIISHEDGDPTPKKYCANCGAPMMEGEQT